MNSAQELHIAVRQGLEKIDSFQDEALFPEEIDLQLNRMQDRYIDTILDNRFEDTQTTLDSLRNLVVRNKSLQAIIYNSTDEDFEPNAVYAILPANYKTLINDRSTIVSSSTYPLCNDLGTPATSSITEYVAQLAFPVSSIPIPGPYFYRPQVTVNGSEVYRAPAAIGTFNNENSKFVIINDLIQTINEDNTLPYTVHWERYRNNFLKNTFFFVTSDASFNGQAVVVNIFQSDGSTVDSSTTDNFNGTGYFIYDSSAITSPITKQVANRLTEKEDIYNLLNTNTFYRTKNIEPLSTLSNRITVYRDKSFIISNIIIDYIRKPNQISLSLDQSCELSETGAREVVDLTIEYIKLAFENPSHQGFVQDNNLRNQI